MRLTMKHHNFGRQVEQEAVKKLYHEDGREVRVGDEVTDFRGEKSVVTGWELPRHSGSTGRVYVITDANNSPAGYYPSVFNLVWK
jgi:hypothetical protein